MEDEEGRRVEDGTQVCGTKPAVRQFKRYQRECGGLEGFETSE